jgi:hypothetical protein
MAVEIFLTQTPSGALIPADGAAVEALERVPKGKVVRAVLTVPRNYAFHKKGFALYGVIYELWSEGLGEHEFRGRKVRPEFTRFRKDLTIMAGFYNPVFNIRGEVRVEAESLSFTSMPQERFEEVYSALIDTALEKVVPHVPREQIEDAVDRIMRFA